MYGKILLSTVLKCLIVFSVILFFEVYFFSIRPNKDEINFINSLNELGSINYLSSLYSTWTPRVFGSGLLFLVWKLCPNMAYLWVFTGVIYSAVFIYSIVTFKKIVADHFQTANTKIDSYLVSVLFFASLFFICTRPAEIFGWYPCFLIYLLPCILSIILILKEHLNYSMIYFSVFIIASGAEHIAIFSNAAIAILLINNFKYSQRKRKQLLVFLALNILLILFFTFTSGSFSRMLYEKGTQTSSFSASFYSLVTSQFSPYLLIGILLSFVIALHLPDLSSRINLKRLLLICTAGYIITFTFYLIVFSNTATGQRIWFLTNVLNIFLIMYLIHFLMKKFNHLRLLRTLSLSTTFLVLVTFFSLHSVKLINYSVKYNNTVYAYQHFKLKSWLKSVPDPGITSNDFPDFYNDMYIKFFNPNPSINVSDN
ncbi:hypothetical protein CNR22_15675 [Sphingobacteriaceae bacterium]|nr:hypothetical protein CNR22_15675 [Sphingobacteriaceae bacterium]